MVDRKYVITEFGDTIFGDVMQFKLRIKQIRKEKGITLRELSDLSGVSKSHLSSIERNEKEAGYTVVVRIALALKVQLEDLIEIEK